MRTRTKIALIVAASLLPIVPALLPINWEFVGPELDPLAHIGGSAYTTVVAGFGIWLFRSGFQSRFPRFLLAGVFSVSVWLVIEPVQKLITYHGPQVSDATADLYGALLGMMVVVLMGIVLAKRAGEKITL